MLQNIVSSLPFLAPMLKRWISDFGYQLGYMKSGMRTTERYALHSFSKASVKSSTMRSNVTSSHHDHHHLHPHRGTARVSRSPSQEHILKSNNGNPVGGITRTMEYHVTVDEGEVEKEQQRV